MDSDIRTVIKPNSKENAGFKEGFEIQNDRFARLYFMLSASSITSRMRLPKTIKLTTATTSHTAFPASTLRITRVAITFVRYSLLVK